MKNCTTPRTSHAFVATPKAMKSRVSPTLNLRIVFVEPSNIMAWEATEVSELHIPNAKTFCSGEYIVASFDLDIVEAVVPCGTKTIAQLRLVSAVPASLRQVRVHRSPVSVLGNGAVGCNSTVC